MSQKCEALKCVLTKVILLPDPIYLVKIYKFNYLDPLASYIDFIMKYIIFYNVCNINFKHISFEDAQ